jgi:hypothetical protein
VQDTTTLNFTTHKALAGQGPIGKNSKSETTGFHAHGTMLLSAQGYVYGMLVGECYARKPLTCGENRRRYLHERNRQKAGQKESARWLRSLSATAVLAGQRPGTLLVNVADREADMYELWLLHSQLRVQTAHLHLLVRSQHNRRLHGQDRLLHDHLAALPAQASWGLELPADRGLAAQARQVEVVWQEVTLAVPAHQKKYQGHGETQTLWSLEVREPHPPAGAEALHWIILSTWPITDEASARTALGWYVQRWQIEVLHRIWKTGCKVEERRVQDPRVMQCLMMLDLMVAVQLLSLVKAARLTPEAPAGVVLGHEQSECLQAWTERSGAAKPSCSTQPGRLRLGEAVEKIARLGGYRGNASKRPPGAEVLWRGLQRLQDITKGWLLAKNQKSG